MDKDRRKKLIDKIIINLTNVLSAGGILVLLTFYLNNQIEKNKIQNSFRFEFNKVKVQKIGESWEELNILEAELEVAVRLQMENLKNGIYNKPFNKEDNPIISDLVKRVNDYGMLVRLEKNRYWIGEKQYQLMVDFASLMDRKVNILIRFNQDSLNIIDELIRQRRKQLDSVIEEMK